MKNALTVFVIPIVLTMFAYSFGLLCQILTLRVTQLARTMPHEAKVSSLNLSIPISLVLKLTYQKHLFDLCT